MSLNFDKVAALTPKLKVGNNVWTGTYESPRQEILKVVRITPTQIVVSGKREWNDTTYEKKFYISGKPGKLGYGPKAGVEVGSGSFRPDYITGLATTTEIRQRAAKLAAERKRQKALANATARRNAKTMKLNVAFSNPIEVGRVSDYSSTSAYAIYNLTEKQVKAIAALLSTQPS